MSVSGWSAPGPSSSWLLSCSHRVPQKCPSHHSPGSKAPDGHSSKYHPICDLSHQYWHLLVYTFHAQCPTKGDKGYNVTSVHPNLKEFTHHLLKVLICYPWDDVELRCQVTKCPPVPQFKFITQLPQHLLHCCHGNHPHWASRLLPWSVASFSQGCSPGTRIGVSMSASVPSGASVLLSSTSLNWLQLYPF